MIASVDYDAEKEKIKTFLTNYSRKSKETPAYQQILTDVANRSKVKITIELDDITKFDSDLAQNIIGNTPRYTLLFSDLIFDLLPSYKTQQAAVKDVLDVFIEHRVLHDLRIHPPDQPSFPRDPRNKFPPELMKRFEVWFAAQSLKKIQIRAVRAQHIGKLLTVHGVVTRATEVKPMVAVATYTCDQCGNEVYQTVNSPSFMPLLTCPTTECVANKAGGRLHMQTRGSKFVKFQELKIQEMSDEIPVGGIPRNLGVFCRGEVTRSCLPGDHIAVTGIFLPVAPTGYFGRHSSQGIVSQMFLEAHQLTKLNKTDDFASHSMEFTAEEEKTIKSTDFYDKLTASVAPEIFGHEDIKKALLLLLVGGVGISPRGMHIRGNINICLMGDPGVAKSQLLIYISKLAMRSQYTTGRGSSGVGLTASVLKDPLTGEMTLEGGALVLADGGVCCIDEFDKMNDTDRCAIHEVMEQQTISIAKAGVVTSLNARVSILVAANPAYGRYNPRKTIEQNVQLPAALLSRFDLLWLMQDRVEHDNDLRLARHVSYLHQHGRHPPIQFTPLSMRFIRKYISRCQKHRPIVPRPLTDYIVSAYVEMRKEARNGKDAIYASARTLLGILRLATALARLRLADTVDKDDVNESMRLMEMSMETLNSERDMSHVRSATDRIWQIVRDIEEDEGSSLSIAQIVERCLVKGFRKTQVEETLKLYENLNVIHINQSSTRLRFL